MLQADADEIHLMETLGGNQLQRDQYNTLLKTSLLHSALTLVHRDVL